MDKIKLEPKIIEAINRDELDLHIFELECKNDTNFTKEDYENIDKSPFHHNCIDIKISINDKQINLFSDLIRVLRLYRFQQPISKRIDESIFTSEYCDIPEDVGIFYGINITQSEKTVTWEILDEETLKYLNKKEFIFDKESYVKELEKVWKFAYKNMTNEIYDSLLFKRTVHDTLMHIKKQNTSCFRHIWDLN